MAAIRSDRANRERTLRYAVIGNLLPLAIAVATNFDSHRTVFFIGAAGTLVAPLAVTFLSRRQPVPFYLSAYGGLVFLTMLQAYSGGPASGYAVLMMMAMVWFGLQGTDRELLVGLAVLAACSFLPMLVFGGPAYPVSWGHAALLVLVGGSVAGSLRAVVRHTHALTMQLRNEADTDDLTGLLNRRGWRQAAEEDLTRARHSRTHVALVAIDLDDLKQINDTLGHDEGDRVLRDTAERMRASLRPGDTLARIGGDEFVALVCDATLDEVLGIVERLRGTTPQQACFSAGVAARVKDESLDELVRRADFALYSAKTGGRDKLVVAPAELAPSAMPG